MNHTAAFRVSSVVTSTIPAHMLPVLDTYAEGNNLSRSAAIRNALLHYAHKASFLTVPDRYNPRHPDHSNMVAVNVSTNIKPDSLRREYEAHAHRCGITMSELVLRCLYAQITNP